MFYYDVVRLFQLLCISTSDNFFLYINNKNIYILKTSHSVFLLMVCFH